jgi:hypothetical protein
MLTCKRRNHGDESSRGHRRPPELHRTDIKGHQLHVELQVISFAEGLAESLLRQVARYGAPSRLSWQLVIPTAGKGSILLLKATISL